MKIILKHIIKNIFENRLISFLIILSLVVSTVVIYLNMGIKDDMMLQYKSILQGTYQNYNYYIYKSNTKSEKDVYFNQEELDLSDLKAKSILGLTRTSGVGNFNGMLSTVNIYGMDLKLIMDKNLLVLEQISAEFDASSGKQIIISSKVAEKYGIKLNDEMIISTLAGKEKMVVGGIAKTKGLYLNEDNKIKIIASSKYVGYLNGMGNKVCGVYVEEDEAIKQDSFSEILKTKNKNFTCISLYDENFIKAELETVNQLLLIVLFAVIIMVLYINAGNTKIIMAKRMPIIGTIRSVGATRLSMNLILIAENMVYGLCGGILGVILGIFLKEPIITAFSSYGKSVSNLNIQYKFNIWHVLFSIGLTVAFQVLISLYGILMASRKSIKEAIFNTFYTKVTISRTRNLLGIIILSLAFILYFCNTGYNLLVSGLVFIFILTGTVCLIPLLTLGISKFFSKVNGKIFGAPAQLGSKNLANNKTIQSSIILATVTLSIMLIVYLATLSINNVFENVGETFEGDIQISGLSEHAEAYKYLYNVEGVKSLKPVYYNFAVYTVNKIQMNMGIFGLDNEMMGIKDIDGRMGKLSEGEALIDKYYGPRNNLKIGDMLTIKSDGVNELTVKIVGYIDSGNFTSNRNVLVVSQSEYIKKVSGIPICIEIDISGDIKKVKDALIKNLVGTGISVQTVDEFLISNKSEVDSLLLMISLMLGLSVVLAFIGVISNQLIGFMQRKKEYAILYSVAMSKSQINIMILMETAGTFIISCLFAGVLGVFLSKALEQILFCIGEYVNISIDIFAILGLLTGMFIILMLTTVLPMKKMLRLNVVHEIKYE